MSQKEKKSLEKFYCHRLPLDAEIEIDSESAVCSKQLFLMATFCRFHHLFLLTSPLRQCSKLRHNFFQQSKISFQPFVRSQTNSWPLRHVIRSFAESVKSRPSIRKSANGAKKPVNGNEIKKPEVSLTLDEELAKLGLYQRYKKLAVEYWYVLLPVHAGLSFAWFGSCYLFARR